MAYDIKRMYSQAKGFQLAGERCVEVREHPEQQWLPIQAIVCFSFACEIYLKAIYQYENPDSDRLMTHYLDDLFGMISDEHKDYVRNELSKVYRTEDIEKYIKESSKVFEDYRYVYEADSDDRKHVGFVYSFSVALAASLTTCLFVTRATFLSFPMKKPVPDHQLIPSVAVILVVA